MTDIYEAREMLSHIPCSALSYQDWVNVGAALHNEGLPCSLWDEWSASDAARYKSGECERKWKTFGHYGEKKQSNKIKNFFDKEEQAPKKEFKRGAF